MKNFMNDCLTYGVDNTSGNKNGWYQTNYACRVVAQTSDTAQPNTINKAWTDRLQDTNFTVPFVEGLSNAEQMKYPYNINPQPFGLAGAPKPQLGYPFMFPVCRSKDALSLPNPISFGCEKNFNKTNELIQTRPYQFDSVDLGKDGCKDYACLNGENSSPVDDVTNILSKAGKKYCTDSINSLPTNKACFDDLVKGIECVKAEPQTSICVVKKAYKEDKNFELLEPVSGCNSSTDCVKNKNEAYKVDCVKKNVCSASTVEQYFRKGFWNVVCDSSVPTSCADYAEKQIKAMCLEDTVTGLNYCAGTLPPVEETTSFLSGIKRVQQLFASIIKIFGWKSPTGDGNTGSYELGPWETETYGTQDNAFNLGQEGTPPQLRPVDGQNNNAEVADAGGKGIDSRQGFSVNGMYGVSGKPAYLMQESQLLAILSFYGFADKNHMPLRRIAIDWGDGGDKVGNGENLPVNYYKNKRGECNTNDTEQGNGGGSESACVSKDPFTYQHTYLFKEAQLDPTHCGFIGTLLGGAFTEFQKQFPNVAPNKPACVYTPKVQLLDNWGWCNATFDSTAIPEGCANLIYERSGCFGTQCDIENNFKAWTLFGGKIIVLPSKE